MSEYAPRLPSRTGPLNGTHASPDLQGEAVPIAVIGMAFKFPQGMESADSFWEALSMARSAWSPFPASRLNHDGVYDPDEERLNSV